MKLFEEVKDWLINRNESKAKSLNESWIEADFDLLYRDNLEKVCSPEEVEQIKGKFIEWTELGNELRVNELTPPSPEKTKRIIKLELFFNNLKNIVNSGRLNEELGKLEQSRTSLNLRMQAIEQEKVENKTELEVGKNRGEKEINVLPKDKGTR